MKASHTPNPGHGDLFLAGVALLGLCALSLMFWLPRFIRPHHGGQLTMCKSNLKNLGTGLELYATDYAAYPPSLTVLTPDYLKIIPTCPTAGRDTYTHSYGHAELADFPSLTCHHHGTEGPCRNTVTRLWSELAQSYTAAGHWPENLAELNLKEEQTHCPYTKRIFVYRPKIVTYEVYCRGSHHHKLSTLTNYPQYNSERGLIER